MIQKYIKNKIDIINAVKINELEILPGHLSFSLIFIIVPIISYIGIIASRINLNISTIRIFKNVPNAVLSLINSMNVNTNDINILIFPIVSLWLSSRGTRAVIIASNLLFKIEEHDKFKIRIKSVVITAILFILISFMIIVPVLGDLIINYLSNILNNNFIIIINNVYNIIKYPISILLIFFLIKTLYTISPTIKIESYYIFTTIMWLVSSRIYSFYLNTFNHYNLYYGSMSNILILLVWVYLLSYIFVIGMSINASNYLKKNSQSCK